MVTTTILAAGAVCIALTAIIAFVKYNMRAVRAVVLYVEDQRKCNELVHEYLDDDTGKLPTFMKEQRQINEVIDYELNPNNGHSLKDQAYRSELRTKRIEDHLGLDPMDMPERRVKGDRRKHD